MSSVSDLLSRVDYTVAMVKLTRENAYIGMVIKRFDQSNELTMIRCTNIC